MSCCRLDKTEACVFYRSTCMKARKKKKEKRKNPTMAVLMRVPTVPQPVPPPLTATQYETAFFFLRFAEAELSASPFFTPFILCRRRFSFFLFFFTPPSKTLQSICSRSISPVTGYLFTSVSVLILIWSVGGGEEARRRGGREREKARTRAALCHSFCFACQRRARRARFPRECAP